MKKFFAAGPIVSAYLLAFAIRTFLIVIYGVGYILLAIHCYHLLQQPGMSAAVSFAMVCLPLVISLVVVALFRFGGLYKSPEDLKMIVSFYICVLIFFGGWFYMQFNFLHLTGWNFVLFCFHSTINQLFIISLFQLIIGGLLDQMAWQ